MADYDYFTVTGVIESCDLDIAGFGRLMTPLQFIIGIVGQCSAEITFSWFRNAHASEYGSLGIDIDENYSEVRKTIAGRGRQFRWAVEDVLPGRTEIEAITLDYQPHWEEVRRGNTGNSAI